MHATRKQLGDHGEDHACHLLRAHGYTAKLLRVNAKTYDVEAGLADKTFMVSVKVSREKQHVRLGSRRSVLGLTEGNFVFAFLPLPGSQIEDLGQSPHALLIIPAEAAREDALSVHDLYWSEKKKDPNIFSVMVKGYGSHHVTIWPRWLTHRDAWHLLPQA